MEHGPWMFTIGYRTLVTFDVYGTLNVISVGE